MGPFQRLPVSDVKASKTLKWSRCVCRCMSAAWCGWSFELSLSVRQQFSLDRLQDVVISIVW